jgi:hypothetical protein
VASGSFRRALGRADQFDADLVELAVAPLLRALRDLGPVKTTFCGSEWVRPLVTRARQTAAVASGRRLMLSPPWSVKV